MAGQVKPIPVPVILAAVNGDENALAAVVAHYQKYIRALATRPVKDEYGNEYLYVDEDMRLRLETKLIHSIVTGFLIVIKDVIKVRSIYFVCIWRNLP